VNDGGALNGPGLENMTRAMTLSQLGAGSVSGGSQTTTASSNNSAEAGRSMRALAGWYR
jgi:hypothetical protein